MRKIAIVVEGQTELIFVREYLLRHFEFQNIEIECKTLFHISKLEKTDYDFYAPNASIHFQIVNVGGDTAILSRIRRREQFFWDNGFEKIIGLRDIFSEKYQKTTQQIEEALNRDIIEFDKEIIQEEMSKPDHIEICFAIMETEAWILGLAKYAKGIIKNLDFSLIKEQLQIDLENDNPETSYFQPSNNLSQIMELAGSEYSKKAGQVNTIMGQIEKSHYEQLLASSFCASFKQFQSAVVS